MNRLSNPVRPSFAAALVACTAKGYVPVIPDIKLKSPKEGDLIRERDPIALAKQFAATGAPALSVVTESEHFAGSLNLLTDVARSVDVPVLRKDFIRDVDDIKATAEAGASAVLLIAAHLSQSQLVTLHNAAHDVGLETLVEVHTEDELAMVRGLDLDTLGINNRDIVNLELDDGTVARTEQFASKMPDGAVIISESGIATAEDVRRAIAAGATAVLIGTAILQADDSVAQLGQFQMALKDGD